MPTSAPVYSQVLKLRGNHDQGALEEAKADLSGRIKAAAIDAVGQDARGVVSALLTRTQDLGSELKGPSPAKMPTESSRAEQPAAAEASRDAAQEPTEAEASDDDAQEHEAERRGFFPFGRHVRCNRLEQPEMLEPETGGSGRPRKQLDIKQRQTCVVADSCMQNEPRSATQEMTRTTGTKSIARRKGLAAHSSNGQQGATEVLPTGNSASSPGEKPPSNKRRPLKEKQSLKRGEVPNNQPSVSHFFKIRC